jgi:hypothetical protein
MTLILAESRFSTDGQLWVRRSMWGNTQATATISTDHDRPIHAQRRLQHAQESAKTQVRLGLPMSLPDDIYLNRLYLMKNDPLAEEDVYRMEAARVWMEQGLGEDSKSSVVFMRFCRPNRCKMPQLCPKSPAAPKIFFIQWSTSNHHDVRYDTTFFPVAFDRSSLCFWQSMMYELQIRSEQTEFTTIYRVTNLSLSVSVCLCS